MLLGVKRIVRFDKLSAILTYHFQVMVKLCIMVRLNRRMVVAMSLYMFLAMGTVLTPSQLTGPVNVSAMISSSVVEVVILLITVKY